MYELKTHHKTIKQTSKMAMTLHSNDHEDDEYIDMEITSFSNFFCHSRNSPPQTREFEFQNMSSISIDREPTTTSPADELFYKGKLLPLHLPPRLQMVEKLLQNSNSVFEDREDKFDELFSTPLATAVTTPLTCTPFESCNISPAESCRVSRELNLEEYLCEYATEEVGCENNQKKSWTKRLNLLKQSSAIGSKLKAASRAYLKSLFSKSSCSDESCAAAKVADEGLVSKSKKNSYQISSNAAIREENNGNRHRRSFSLAIRRHSTKTKSSSSSSSSSSSLSSGSSSSSSSNASNGNNFHYLQFLKRSSSVNTEIENPIQGAIAHCKQSHQQQQQLMKSRKAVSEVGFYSLSNSTISVYEDEERPELCRG